MNFNLVFNLTGKVLLLEGVSMLLPLYVAILYGESPLPFIYAVLITLFSGFILSRLPYKKHFFAREGFFAVGLIWVLMGLFGALPFHFCGQFNSFIDCLFECYSGFTTTGASILTNIEAMPKGILFWRSFTHWLGGMGVLVLTTALLPSMGLRSHFLIQAESPGPVFSKLMPKQSQTSKILYTIYCVMTVVEIGLLKLAGLPLYDSFIHAFSTAGTGGFSNRNLSVGAYENPTAEMIIAIFMLLFSVNFAMYFLLLCGRAKDVLNSDELRFFLGVTALAVFFSCINIYPIYHSVWQSFRFAFFQVSSIISTTGFATADYMTWPVFSQVIMILLLLCGACAGSTGGGMKCSRILLLVRCLRREIRQIIHPRNVSVVKLDGKVVEENTLRSVMLFTGCYFLISLMATLVVAMDNFSFTTSFSAAFTCMSNVGPGLDIVGPAGNFAAFSGLSKLVLSSCMVIGRLEIFPILVLFSRSAWRRA
ncbi:MAG: TrkH family potassium uptake protein [Oscillospiraceae bacterium]|nr:TrkH family potassium uptake protein [Oscillospiraceae bacterium]